MNCLKMTDLATSIANNKKNEQPKSVTAVPSSSTQTPRCPAAIICPTNSDGDSSSNSGTAGKDIETRHCTSLPLFYSNHASDLCGIGAQPGMECMPLRTPPGPYHYHVTDQTKSLQELQNEVGALLEFRDLVIETFPDLKHKMASISATNTLTGMASGSSLASRREWEPGIRVKRKLGQKETNQEMSSSLIRSRSNSHSGKKEPKSGEGNGSVVQDSGFSTETSSSKEAHSASSTTGAMQGAVASNRLPIDSDDELLNLLDVIHRKSNRLRDEVEHLQNLERDKFRKTTNLNNLSSSNSSSSNNSTCLNKTFHDHIDDRLTKDDVQVLRKERDRLLDKLAEMEAETLTERINATKIQDQFEELCSVRKELEEQLKLALSQKHELHSRLQEFNKVYSSKNSTSSSELSYRQSSGSVMQLGNVSTTPTSQATSQLIGNRISALNNSSTMATTFTPVQLFHQSSTTTPLSTDFDSNSCYTKTSANTTTATTTTATYPFQHSDYKQIKNDLNNLGRLDGLISSPNRVKVRVTDSRKIAAILLETNVLELQRHLLTLTVQNQVLNQRLELAMRSKLALLEKLGKSKEDMDDMKFQLEEKDIELEGTKAQLRVLEAKTASRSDYNSSETNRSSSTLLLSPTCDSSPMMPPSQISTPSMKAMTPLAMEEIQQHSSSTESAQDQTERDSRLSGGPDTPKRRPSKIPLPGTKGYLAPKPPTGRSPNSHQQQQHLYHQQRSPTGPSSNKSLSRSTGSLYGKSGPPSVKRETPFSSSLHRPDSAQSLRKDTSLVTNASRSSSSSIPISSKSTPSPQRISNSPLPRPKRDSLTSRARHLDSLSRVHTTTSTISPATVTTTTTANGYYSNQMSNSSNMSSNSTLTSSTSNLYKSNNNSNSKKDLSSSFTQGQLRDRKQAAVSVRRVSSASIGGGRNTTVELQQNDADSGKIQLQRVGSYDIQEINKLTTSSCTNLSLATTATLSSALITTETQFASSTPSTPFRNSNSKSIYTARDLIREFMAKNSSPPAILKPSYQLFEYSQDFDLAYKHPELLARFDRKSDTDCNLSNSAYSSERNSVTSKIGCLDQNSNLEFSKERTFVIMPEARKQDDKMRIEDGKIPCKLVGNVAKNIVKTWEQINAGCNGGTARSEKSNSNGKRKLIRTASNQSDESDSMIYYQQVDENKANFHVNKVVYAEDAQDASMNFYDSIDDGVEVMNGDNIVSISQQDAGEDLADFDSFERKVYSWSLDSELKVNGNQL